MGRSLYYSRLGTGLLISRGNHKLGTDILIINPGSATTCPSKVRGFCRVDEFANAKCYSIRDELYWPATLQYRTRQREYWLSHTAEEIIEDFNQQLTRLRLPVRWLRFAVSGDFFNQACVDKLDKLSYALKKRWDIGTFTYTANPTLDFTRVHFVIRGSGHDNCPHGKTIVIPKDTETPRGFYQCPMDCTRCDVCKLPDFRNIAFPNHAPARRTRMAKAA